MAGGEVLGLCGLQNSFTSKYVTPDGSQIKCKAGRNIELDFYTFLHSLHHGQNALRVIEQRKPSVVAFRTEVHNALAPYHYSKSFNNIEVEPQHHF